MTPLTELQEFFALAAKNIARIFHEKGEVIPMWHAVDAQGEHILIATPWSNDREKDIAVQGLRQMFKEKGVKRYAFMVEAWMRHAASREDISARVSEHPDRREIVNISAEDRKGNRLMGWYYILRPEHGKATLSPLHMGNEILTSGRFTGMLQ